LILRAAILGVALFAANAAAQPGLPAPNTERLTAADRSALQTYTEFFLDQLQSGDIDEVESARAALLRPLNDPDLTVPYRLAYTQSLGQPLADLLTDLRDRHRVANALNISGRLADRTSVGPIVNAIQDDDLATRLAGSSALNAMMLELSRPGVTPVQRRPIDDLLQAAREAIRTAEDGETVESLSAAVMGGRADAELRDRGLAIIVTTARERAIQEISAVDLNETAWPEAVRLGLGEIRTRLVTAAADENFPREFLRDATDLAGIGLALAGGAIEAADDTSDALRRHLALAIVAENVAQLAISRATGDAVAPLVVRNAILDAIEEQDPAAARDAIRSLIEPGGAIDDSPFDLDINRYNP
jgi:hypothetical protein